MIDKTLNPVEISFFSNVAEEFLAAELMIQSLPRCVVLKRLEAGPVLLAFYENGNEALVDPEDFIEKLREAVAEIRALRHNL